MLIPEPVTKASGLNMLFGSAYVHLSRPGAEGNLRYWSPYIHSAPESQVLGLRTWGLTVCMSVPGSHASFLILAVKSGGLRPIAQWTLTSASTREGPGHPTALGQW